MAGRKRKYPTNYTVPDLENLDDDIVDLNEAREQRGSLQGNLGANADHGDQMMTGNHEAHGEHGDNADMDNIDDDPTELLEQEFLDEHLDRGDVQFNPAQENHPPRPIQNGPDRFQHREEDRDQNGRPNYPDDEHPNHFDDVHDPVHDDVNGDVGTIDDEEDPEHFDDIFEGSLNMFTFSVFYISWISEICGNGYHR